MIQTTNSALRVMAAALAATIAPREAIAPSKWADENLVVADGPKAGEPYDLSLTPYIIEPLDMLAPGSGVNELACMKGVQTGFTTLLIAFIGFTIDRDPCRFGILQPTDSALSEFNRDKLDPSIAGSKILREKVASQVSRSTTGSTTYSKKYPGGSLSLMLASSAADLRSKTLKKMLRDEIDQYPDDLDGQGDPLELSDGRLVSFLASGEWKKADISTPTIVGKSKIHERYLAGDQRRWNVTCPACRSEFVFEWGPNFKYNATVPYDAHYITPCCGHRIDGSAKFAVAREGRWVATASRAGAFPSYHFDTLASPFVPWDFIVKKFFEAGDDQQKIKAFWNLYLGLPYEVKGDAPDHVRLMERREAYPKFTIPPQGVLFVGAADVQGHGIWHAEYAFAPDGQSWVIDAGYIDGSTESVDAEAFIKLKQQVIDREYNDSFGGKRKLDAFGIDSGFRTNVVYSYVRKHQSQHSLSGYDILYALDGRDGWGKPALGIASPKDIDLAGHIVKAGVKLWPVGTWPLKTVLYTNLHKVGISGGASFDPPGYIHCGTWLDETFFKQITAEYLGESKAQGKVQKKWMLPSSKPDNHILDASVYALALAEHLGLSIMTEDDWLALADAFSIPRKHVLGNIRNRLIKPVDVEDGDTEPRSIEEIVEVVKTTPLPAQKPREPEFDIYEAFAKLNEGL